MGKPQIAIITPNTLTGIGLKDIIGKMMPGAELCLMSDMATFAATNREQFFHYFISARVFLDHAPYFLERLHKTIVLVHGDETGHLPQRLHTLNVCLPEDELVKQLLKLAETAHRPHHSPIIQQAKCPCGDLPVLTSREIEVLRLLVSGLINKEIAAQLNVSLATVISHRKNITDKLNIKSLSGLTIYAVSHGIILAEEI